MRPKKLPRSKITNIGLNLLHPRPVSKWKTISHRGSLKWKNLIISPAKSWVFWLILVVRWLVGFVCFFACSLKFKQILFSLKKNKNGFPRSAFLKHLLQDHCLILSSTICDTSSHGSHLSAKLCRVASTLQKEENTYILIPQLLYMAIQKAHEETVADTSFCISNFYSILCEHVKPAPQHAGRSTQSPK